MKTLKEKFLTELEECDKTIQAAEHILTVTYPLIKEKKLLINLVESAYHLLEKLINLVIDFEYKNKTVSFYGDFHTNWETFREIHKKYIEKDVLANLEKIRKIYLAHKQSPIEFTKQDEFVIMLDSLDIETVNQDKLMSMLNALKNLSQVLKKRWQ